MKDGVIAFFGYYLLGVIIERVSGKSYIEFINENIFKPLGMNNSGIDDYREILSDKANGYFLSGDRLICSEIDTMSAFSAGALYSTIPNLILWDEALYDEKLVSKETMNEIFTPYKEGYGYGWVIGSNFNRKTVNHSGGGNGFNHQFHRYIDDKVTILVLSNYGFSNSISINKGIAEIVFGNEDFMPSKPKVYKLDLNIYDSDYAGIYEEEYFKYEFKRDKDKLYFIQEDKWVMPIYPISENVFHHAWIDKKYIFEKDEDGKVYFCGIKKSGM